MYSTVAWAKTSGDSDFSKINISRNVAGENDVTFDLKYCGICHTDVNVACLQVVPLIIFVSRVMSSPELLQNSRLDTGLKIYVKSRGGGFFGPPMFS